MLSKHLGFFKHLLLELQKELVKTGQMKGKATQLPSSPLRMPRLSHEIKRHLSRLIHQRVSPGGQGHKHRSSVCCLFSVRARPFSRPWDHQEVPRRILAEVFLKTPAVMPVAAAAREAPVTRAQAGVHVFIPMLFVMEPFCRGDSGRLKAANDLVLMESLLTVKKN